MRSIQYILREDAECCHLTVREVFEQKITLDLDMALVRLSDIEREIESLTNTLETLNEHRNQLIAFIDKVKEHQNDDEDDGEIDG